jgi:alkaline phosphatase D
MDRGAMPTHHARPIRHGFRRRYSLFVFFLPLILACSVGQDMSHTLQTIGFGSCAMQGEPQPIWDAVNATDPDLFIFLGDNIYADATQPTEWEAKYAMLGAEPGFQQLRAQSLLAATWDDHDYGANDAGAEFPGKQQARAAFLSFWDAPLFSARRLRNGGIYTAAIYGTPGQRVQLILLDTRWNRSPLNLVSEEEFAARLPLGIGPYTATDDPSATLLGAAQWRWLEQQLRMPAELRLIATSIPFLRAGSGWESWTNFPSEQARLIELIAATQASGVLFITGDTHHAQFSLRTEGVPYPLWEMNSSGLTENNGGIIAPDSSRVGGANAIFAGDNYGLIQLDWAASALLLEIRDTDNRVVLNQRVDLEELQGKW